MFEKSEINFIIYVMLICQNNGTCIVEASNSVFGDPRQNTYKYLSIEYECKDVKESTTCENREADLTCKKGEVINIITANFGRTSATVCSHPNILNTSCISDTALPKVQNQCQGQNNCSIQATTAVFGEPCKNTYKYLVVHYTCDAVHIETTTVSTTRNTPSTDTTSTTTATTTMTSTSTSTDIKDVIICENNRIQVDCGPRKQISLISYGWGRTSSDICSKGIPKYRLEDTCCNSKPYKIFKNCQGYRSCSMDANIQNLGDPCWDTQKYLNLQYKCVKA